MEKKIETTLKEIRSGRYVCMYVCMYARMDGWYPPVPWIYIFAAFQLKQYNTCFFLTVFSQDFVSKHCKTNIFDDFHEFSDYSTRGLGFCGIMKNMGTVVFFTMLSVIFLRDHYKRLMSSLTCMILETTPRGGCHMCLTIYMYIYKLIYIYIRMQINSCCPAASIFYDAILLEGAIAIGAVLGAISVVMALAFAIFSSKGFRV